MPGPPRLAVLGALLALTACGATPPEDVETAAAKGVGGKADGAGNVCPLAESTVRTGDIDDDLAVELSGLVVSRQQPGVLWAHNDGGSGKRNRLLAVDARGRTLAHVKLHGLDNNDWEDIALGPGSRPGHDALYVGDIGDNDTERNRIAIIVLEEPEIDPSANEVEHTVRDAREVSLRYDDGRARNAEALFIDTMTDTLYVISKAPGGDLSELFAIGLPLRDDDERLRFVGDQRELPGLQGVVVAADASADGKTLAIATRREELRSWSRATGESVSDMLARPACASDVPRRHTEALALLPSGSGAMLVPEGEHPDLHLVPFASVCGTWLPPVLNADIRASTSDELSGLVSSRAFKGVQWAHPDGDDGRSVIFAIDEDGELLAEIELSDVHVSDWEDIARLDQHEGPDILVVADMGAKHGLRDHITLNLFHEPDPFDGDDSVDVRTMALRYADGKPRDAEATFVDDDGTLVVITQPDTGPTTVFAAEAPWDDARLEPVIDASDAPYLGTAIVAADRSASGALALLSTDNTAFVWPASSLPLAERLRTEPCRAPMPRGDFESIAWSRDGDSLWTVREGKRATRWEVTRH